MKEKKAPVEDVLHCDLSGRQEESQPGWRVPVVCATWLNDEQFGIDIVRRACEEPARYRCELRAEGGSSPDDQERAASNFGFKCRHGNI